MQGIAHEHFGDEAGHHGFAATYRPGTDQQEQKDIEQRDGRQCDGRVQCFLEEIHASCGPSRLPLLSSVRLADSKAGSTYCKRGSGSTQCRSTLNSTACSPTCLRRAPPSKSLSLCRRSEASRIHGHSTTLRLSVHSGVCWRKWRTRKVFPRANSSSKSTIPVWSQTKRTSPLACGYL